MKNLNASPAGSPTRSPRFASPLPAEAPKESAVARFFIAPLTFISFLISLAIIDSRNHRLRSHQHSSPRTAPIGVYQHVKYYLHASIYKPVPSSPYAYIKSPEKIHVQDVDIKVVAKDEGEGTESWHWHTKQRHMMKAEMEEAFKVRKWVVVLMFSTGGAAIFTLGMMWRWVGYLLGFNGR